eukprot:4471221-Amphidinium_carterae.1
MVEPTTDQISEMVQTLRDGSVPYVDFVIFGPRNQRKLHVQAFHLQPDCSWKRTEVAGPPDFPTWWASYRLLKTLYLLVGVAQIERIDTYGKKIWDFYDLSSGNGEGQCSRHSR